MSSSGFELDIVIFDTATPYLKAMVESKPQWLRKAMKSAGWWMQKEIKAGIRSGAPGGVRYARFMPPGIRSKIERVFGNSGKKNYVPLGKLSNAVGYQYNPAESSVSVGWLSKSAVKLGDKIEAGITRNITQKMRNYFFMAGVPLSSKAAMVIPARKTYEPMRNMLEPKVSSYLEDKIFNYMALAADGISPESSGKTSKRRYRVF